MGRIVEEETETCLSEALLFVTMCMIGIPVDVHIRDGSVFSGIFHTASPTSGFGIVLKEARLTKKGKCDTNVACGHVVDTLVILADDLVQVVAKGVRLSTDCVTGIVTGDDVEASVTSASIFGAAVEEDKKSNRLNEDVQKIYQHRHFLEHRQREQDSENYHIDVPSKSNVDEDQSSSRNMVSSLPEATSIEKDNVTTNQLSNRVSYDAASSLIKSDNQCCERSTSVSTSENFVTSSVSTAFSPVVDTDMASPSATSTVAPSPQITQPHKKSKEFKLNPEAKVFSPSYAKLASATTPANPAVANMGFVPNNSPIAPAASTLPEVGIGNYAPRQSFTSKISPYNNSTAGNGGSGSQYSQTAQFLGHISSRAPPIRYAGQYHAVQTAPAYIPPNSQAVMVGRVGQVVYVQPVPQDLVQSTAAVSSLPAGPLLTPHHVQYTKHLGNAAGQALQLYMPPPLVASSGQQPFPLPNHIPVMPPQIPANHNIPLPGSNAFFGQKFP